MLRSLSWMCWYSPGCPAGHRGPSIESFLSNVVIFRYRAPALGDNIVTQLSQSEARMAPLWPIRVQHLLRLWSDCCAWVIFIVSRPCQISIISANFVLNIMSCSSLLSARLNTNRKCAQVIWRTHGAIWKNVRWVGSEHEVIMIMTVFPPYLNIKWWECKLLPILLINKTARPWLEL